MSSGIGIYLGRKYVVGIRVDRTGGKILMRGWGMEPLVESSEKESEEANRLQWNPFQAPKATSESLAIKKLLAKIGVTKAYAGVAISPYHLVTRQFIMPELPEREKEEAVRYEASRHTRFKLSDTVFGYTENGKADKAVSVTANAVKKRVIQSTIMHLRRGNVEPLWIEPDYSAFSRSTHLFGFAEVREMPHGLIWFEDDGGVNLTLVSKGIVFLSQDFRLSGEAKQDYDKMHDEIQASLRYLRETTAGAQPQVIYMAGFADLKMWESVLSRHLQDIEIRQIDLTETWGIPEAQAGAYVVPLGLALGAAGVESPIGKSNLLPKEERKMSPEKLTLWVAVAAFAVVFALFILYFGILSPIVRSIEAQKIRAEAPLAAFGAQGNFSLDELSIRQLSLQGRVQILKGFKDRRFPMYGMMAALTQNIPPEIWLERMNFSVINKDKNSSAAKPSEGVNKNQPIRYALKIEGNCYRGSAEQEGRIVNEWVQKLSKVPAMQAAFSNFSIEEIKQTKQMDKTVTRFSILAES